MSDCLSSRRQNPSATLASRHGQSGPRLGEAGRSVRRSLLWIILLLVTLAGARPWANAQNPLVVGQFSPLMNWPFNPVHAVLLPSGKVLWWSSYNDGDKPQIWDPVTETQTAVTPAGYNIFCSGLSLLGNGQVLITGGDAPVTPAGVANASIYDPVSGNWTFLPNMNAGRFYPTNTVLPNGDVVVTGEISPALGVDPLPQVWQVSAVHGEI